MVRAALGAALGDHRANLTSATRAGRAREVTDEDARQGVPLLLRRRRHEPHGHQQDARMSPRAAGTTNSSSTAIVASEECSATMAAPAATRGRRLRVMAASPEGGAHRVRDGDNPEHERERDGAALVMPPKRDFVSSRSIVSASTTPWPLP